MRRWVIIFLLTVLPMQFASAAAAAYCRHETNAAAQHFGHHEHRHQLSAEKVAGDSPSDHKSSPAGTSDLDCAYCHLSCAQPLSSAASTWTGALAHATAAPKPLSFRSRGPDVLDRPNWTLAV